MGIDREAVAWAAGLFEGEGTFCIGEPRLGRTKGIPAVALASTDEDVLLRFACIIGVGKVNGPYVRGDERNRKPLWQWQSNRFEVCQHVASIFWPWLGERRRKQYINLLGRYMDEHGSSVVYYPHYARGPERILRH